MHAGRSRVVLALLMLSLDDQTSFLSSQSSN
jgi:hypothetical protein